MSNYLRQPASGLSNTINGYNVSHPSTYNAGLPQYPYQIQTQNSQAYGQAPSPSNGITPQSNTNSFSFQSNAQNAGNRVNQHLPEPSNPNYPPFQSSLHNSHLAQSPFTNSFVQSSTIDDAVQPLASQPGLQTQGVQIENQGRRTSATSDLEDGEVDDEDIDRSPYHPESIKMGSTFSRPERAGGKEQDKDNSGGEASSNGRIDLITRQSSATQGTRFPDCSKAAVSSWKS